MQNIKGIIEAILFSAGCEVSMKNLQLVLEKSKEEIEEIVKMEDNYMLASKKEYYEYIYKVIDKRSKPKLSNAALETLSIIAYNPRIAKSEIEAIRRSKCRWNNV